MPVFGDMDGDGDFDMFSGEENNGLLFYYENVGSPVTPFWATPSREYVTQLQSDSATIPAVVDIDGDGDLDLYVGEERNNIDFYENTGTVRSAAWAPVVTNVTGGDISNRGARYWSPTFYDVDDDGDKDMFIGTYSGAVHFCQECGHTLPNPCGQTSCLTILYLRAGRLVLH